MNADDRIYTRGEIAKILGVSVRTVVRWHDEDGLPWQRQGPSGHIVASRVGVLAWYKQFCRPLVPRTQIRRRA